jgi:hypothetical protein
MMTESQISGALRGVHCYEKAWQTYSCGNKYSYNNRGTVGYGVFYAVCPQVILG